MAKPNAGKKREKKSKPVRPELPEMPLPCRPGQPESFHRNCESATGSMMPGENGKSPVGTQHFCAKTVCDLRGRSFSAHERLTVKRATAEEGMR